MRGAFGLSAIGFAMLVLGLLAALHALSPEFDPSWRVVSEYANGHYGWVLTLMFGCWALASWTLAYAAWPYARTRSGRLGLCVLVVAGSGQALAAALDINQPLHGLADLLGAFGLPVAAMLVSLSLKHELDSSRGGRTLLWLANLTWVTTVATLAGIVLLFLTYTHAGGHAPSDGKPLPVGTILPMGVVAVVGYAKRLYVVVSCLWTIVAAMVVMDLNSRDAGDRVHRVRLAVVTRIIESGLQTNIQKPQRPRST